MWAKTKKKKAKPETATEKAHKSLSHLCNMHKESRGHKRQEQTKILVFAQAPKLKTRTKHRGHKNRNKPTGIMAIMCGFHFGSKGEKNMLGKDRKQKK